MTYSYLRNACTLRANLYLLDNRATWLEATGEHAAAEVARDWADTLHMQLLSGSCYGSIDLLPASCLTLDFLLIPTY